MPSIPQPRRTASLLAAGATSAAAVFLGFAAPAQAAPLSAITISTDSGSGADQVVSGSYTIPTGYCAVQWSLVGAGGGAGFDGNTTGGQGNVGLGGMLAVTTPVTAGQVVSLVTGVVGADATAAGHGAGGAGAPSGAAGADQVSGPGGGGGGGGGATSVSISGLTLVARGGDGGAADGSTNGGAGGNGTTNTVSWAGSTTGQDDPAGGGTGDGSIFGTVNPCPPAPGAPTNVSASGGNGQATVYFSPDPSGYADSWQYSIDSGTWTGVTVDSSYSFTLSSLTNGTTYSVRVRGLDGTTPGDPSTAVSVTPAVPNGAPTNVRVTPGPSSYVVTWDAPATSGTFPVASYTVGWSGGQMGGPLCEDVPVSSARRCVGAAVPGSSYTVSVTAIDTKGNWGDTSADVPVGTVAAPPVPTAPPASADQLTLPAGQSDSVAAGKQVTLSGSGYLPNSTVTLIAYSSPQVLTSVVTDASGNFTVTVTVPEGLESGQHTLVASGVDPSGAVRYVTLPVTVIGGTTGAGGLAYTGVDVAWPLTGGAIAVAAGAALMVVARRRKAADTTI